MPKIPIDYSKTIIYKLVCNDLDVLYTYVGHSTNFKERKRHHKDCCNNENDKSYNIKVYKIIRENGGWENWTMVSIENFPCNDINEATKRERYWYEILNANMNINVPNRDKKEYYIEYYIENKEKILEQNKKWREENTEYHKEFNKNWYIDNKEKKLEQNKKWREENTEYLKEKINCECGGKYIKSHISTHNKTKKHQNFIKNQQGLISLKNYA